MPDLTESIAEDVALTWFGELVPQSREVGHGPQMAPGEPASRDGGRDSFGEVVLVGRLRETIRRPAGAGPGIPEDARATVAQSATVQIERRLNP